MQKDSPQSNEHIREFLRYYCSLPKSPGYAVLLTGPWGSGKTWFAQDFLKQLYAGKEDESLYISLYGLQSFEQIDEEFFRQLHPWLASKGARLLGRVAKGALKGVFKLDLDSDGKPDGEVTIQMPSESFLNMSGVPSSKLLVFDDLERCSIPIGDLLGYINRYVEHSGFKAILLANETELLNPMSPGHALSNAYNRTKEKLVGRSFQVVPEVGSALTHFFDELPTERVRQVTYANREIVAEVYTNSGFENLRLLRHALWEFDRLVGVVEPKVLASDPLLADLLALYLTYAFEIRSGSLQANEIRRARASDYSAIGLKPGQANPDQKYVDMRAKYPALRRYESLVPDVVWESIFATGSIPAVELNEALLNSSHFPKHQPNWVRFWHGQDLPDEEFEQLLATVASEWEERRYCELGIVLHIAGLLLKYARGGVYPKTEAAVFGEAKAYVDWLLETGNLGGQKLGIEAWLETRSYGGLGFASEESPLLVDIMKYVVERRGEAVVRSYPAQARELLGTMGEDPYLFIQRLCLSNDPENRYYSIPILTYLKPEEFVDRLLEITPGNLRTVVHAFEQRYSIDSINPSLTSELPWLHAVSDLLRGEIAKRAGKVSSLTLERFVDPYLSGAIARLEKALGQSAGGEMREGES